MPTYRQHMPLIQALQTDEWWQYVNLGMLETVRKNLRGFITIIKTASRKVVFTDFEDEMGEEKTFDLPGFSAPDTFEKFRAKARQFLLAHGFTKKTEKTPLQEIRSTETRKKIYVNKEN